VRVFESGSILLYLAEKFGACCRNRRLPHRSLNWLFWQMGAAPYLGGGFGHFYVYAPEKFEYAINRFTMEAKRQLDVLDRRLAESRYLGGEDTALPILPCGRGMASWYAATCMGGEFLAVDEYPNVQRWAEEIAQRPAVQRGTRVNRTWG
jgi:GST-like protein